MTTPPNVVWEKTYGGAGDDMGAYVSQTSDGGYIITGATSPSTAEADRDIWLIKTDAAGNEIWDKTFGGEAEDVGMSVLPTPDGGYLIGGLTDSFSNGDASIWLIWLIKTDASGNKVWDKTFGGTRVALVSSMMLAPDGGYILTGATGSDFQVSSDALVIKTDSEGNQLWSQTYGGADYDHAWSSQPTPDGGYIIIGGTDSFGHGDIWLIKTDANGNELWNKAYEGGGDDYGFMVTPTDDGGYILAGTGSSGAGKKDFWLIKTDALGNKIWDKSYGGENDDDLGAAQQTPDGGYILAGTTSSFGAGGKDAWLVRTDADGNKLWEKTLGGAGDDYATNAVFETANGDYIMIGYTNSSGAGGNDVWLVKLSH
jgi:hypothetical protein